MSCRADKNKEAQNAFPRQHGNKELICAAMECIPSESRSGRLKSVLSENSARAKEQIASGITVYTNDCLRDYYLLKKEGVRFLSEPYYTMAGLVAEFIDHSGNTYLLVEERNYSDD